MTAPLPATASTTSSATSPRSANSAAGYDEHAHGHEEQHREQVAERRDLRRGLVREVGFGDDETGHERPERERQPEDGARDERRQQRGRDHRQQEQLVGAEAGDPREDHGKDASADDVGHGQEHHGLDEGQGEGPAKSDPSASGGRTTMNTIVARSWTIDQPIAERPCRLSSSPRSSNDLSTTSVEEIDRQAPTTSASRRSEPTSSIRPDPASRMIGDLGHPARQRQTTNLLELADRGTRPEGEEQQDDADVGEHGDALDVADEPGGERADDDPGEQVADDGRLPEPDGDRAAEQGQADGDPEIQDEPELVAEAFDQLAVSSTADWVGTSDDPADDGPRARAPRMTVLRAGALPSTVPRAGRRRRSTRLRCPRPRRSPPR